MFRCWCSEPVPPYICILKRTHTRAHTRTHTQTHTHAHLDITTFRYTDERRMTSRRWYHSYDDVDSSSPPPPPPPSTSLRHHYTKCCGYSLCPWYRGQMYHISIDICWWFRYQWLDGEVCLSVCPSACVPVCLCLSVCPSVSVSVSRWRLLRQRINRQ